VNDDNFPITYEEHTQVFHGRGEGFNPMSQFTRFIRACVTEEVLMYGHIEDFRLKVFATLIVEGIDNRN